MNRQKCQHGIDKVRETKERSASGEREGKFTESTHEKWQIGTDERRTVCG